MKIIIFGTGSAAENALFQINDSIEIVAVSDNDKNKWGLSWHNQKVIPPLKINNVVYDYILICSMYSVEIIDSLLALGIKREKIIQLVDNVDWQKKYKEQLTREKEIREIILPKRKNRKIAFLTRRNSGCNALALFKNTDKADRDKLDIELLNLDDYKKNWEEYDLAFTTHMEGRMYKNRINIEAWHGFPLKSLGVHEKNRVDNISNTNNGIDYILSYSHLYSYIMSSVYEIDLNKFITTGMPRNDLLINKNAKKMISNIIGKEVKNKNIIFYVPTFRKRVNKNVNEGANVISDYHDFELLDKFLLKSNSYLIIKKHPVEEANFNENIFQNIFFMNDHNLQEYNIDFYEILGGSDLLITDYSSVYFDYLLLNKPIVFWTKDQETYENNRGFILDNPETMMPGPNVKCVEDLIQSINRFFIDDKWYSSERNHIKRLVHKYDDFNSSKRVWDLIISNYEENS